MILPQYQRRALLEQLAKAWQPPFSLSPTATDPKVAAQAFESLPHTGIKGLVSKGNRPDLHARCQLMAVPASKRSQRSTLATSWPRQRTPQNACSLVASHCRALVQY